MIISAISFFHKEPIQEMLKKNNKMETLKFKISKINSVKNI